MKRKIFFWLDKLKISSAERRAVLYLLITLVLLVLANAVVSPGSPFDDAYYKELDDRFRKRTALMNQENEQLLARYERRPARPESMTTQLPDTNEEKTAADTTAQGSLINVNTADSKTLQKLRGIGVTYAQRIIAYRQENGGFKSKQELLKINGIGATRLQNIKLFITVGDTSAPITPTAADTFPITESTEQRSNKAEVGETNPQFIINVNTAEVKTLQKLQGIGPAYARRIVRYRQENGFFKTKDELLKIKGIGEKRLAKIVPFIKLTDQQ